MRMISIVAVLLLGLSAQAKDLPILNGAMKTICEAAYLPLSNGNFKTVNTVLKRGKKLSFISHYGLEKDSNFITALDNNNGQPLFSIYTEGFRVVDMEITENSLWAVANSYTKETKLYRIDFFEDQAISIKNYPTHNLQADLGKYDKAYGLSSDDKFVYIAHGGIGLVKFDIKNEKPIDHIKSELNPGTSHRSYITDALVVRDKIFVGADNITYNFSNKTRAFEGYAILDRETLKLTKRIPINQKREALFEPKLFHNKSKDQIVMSTLHLHFVNRISSLSKSKIFVPEMRIFRYQKGKPIGLSDVTDSMITGCFKDDKELPPQFFPHSEKF